MIKNRVLLLYLFTVAAVVLAACGAAPVKASSVTATPVASVPQATVTSSQPQATQPAASTPVPKASATSSQSQATQPGPSMSSDEVIKAVQAAWAALGKAGSRHVSQTAYKGNVAIMNIEADSVPPNMHQIVSLNGQVYAEQYIYNGTIYNKVSGKWTKYTGSAKVATNALAGFAEGLADQIVLSDGKVLGIENVNGKPATVYSYNSSLKGISTSPTTHTVWVDVATGLPVKQEILKSDGEKTMQQITYDSSITITLPPDAAAAPEQQ